MDGIGVWLAYPLMLGLLAFLPILAVLMLRARRKRLRACALWGQVAAVQRLRITAPSSGRWRTVCLFLGLTLLIIGAAGPRWGWSRALADPGPQRALVLVVDLSRSMLAEVPARQDLAKRALRDLALSLSKNGGPRVALVLFAAQAQLVFPLTSDYDHLLDALRRVDADDLPRPLRPGEGSAS